MLRATCQCFALAVYATGFGGVAGAGQAGLPEGFLVRGVGLADDALPADGLLAWGAGSRSEGPSMRMVMHW